jgi:hypothetical protein
MLLPPTSKRRSYDRDLNRRGILSPTGKSAILALDWLRPYPSRICRFSRTAEQRSARWAMLLIGFARIGVMRALNRNVERVFNPDNKDTHWGKRKLERDE